jgi:hypothetical protein
MHVHENKMKKAQLRFTTLSQRHYLTKAASDSLSEAARVCLDRHHTPAQDFEISSKSERLTARANWKPSDEKTRATWANKVDATEAGACCLALAAIELTHACVTIGRADTGTGADYYLSAIGSDAEDFEAAFRLEVSGMDKSTTAALRARLSQKVQQAKDGNSNLPAVASVVAFADLQIVTADVEKI